MPGVGLARVPMQSERVCVQASYWPISSMDYLLFDDGDDIDDIDDLYDF